MFVYKKARLILVFLYTTKKGELMGDIKLFKIKDEVEEIEGTSMQL